MRQTTLKLEYISSVCLDLHLIMKAGISFDEGLSIMTENESDIVIKEVLTKIGASIEDGSTINDAFAETALFPAYMINMLKIGEKTGNLDRVFKSLADYYATQRSIAQALRRAALFPSLLFMMMLAVVGILIVQVLPLFNDVFSQLGANMSVFAVTFMNFGVAIKDNFYIILILVAVMFFAGLLIYFVPTWRRIFLDYRDKVLFATKLGSKIGSARFASGMVMGLSSGLNIDASLEMAGVLCRDTPAAKRVETCREMIGQGIGIAESVAKTELFDPIHCRMLAIGLKTGAAETVIREIARQSEDMVQESIEQAIGQIEPVFVVIMSLLVGFVLLSVMIPMMSIMSSIG